MFRHSGKTLALSVLLSAASVPAQTVTKQLNFAQPTVGIAANFFTDHIYVAAPSYGGAHDYVTVINGKTDAITDTITVPRGAQLPVVDLIRNFVYIAGCDTYGTSFKCIVTKINGRDNKVVKTATVTTTEGDGIIGIAFDPIFNKLYLANGSNYRIDVVDANTLHVCDGISTNGQEPFGISLNPLNHRLYVPYYTNQVQIFDTNTKALIDTATYGSSDVATAVNWFTGNFYVSDNVFGPSTTGALDKNGAILASIPVSDTPYNLDVDLITNKVFVVSTGISALTEIDGASNTVTGVNQSVNGNYVAVNSATHKVYVSGNLGVTVLSE